MKEFCYVGPETNLGRFGPVRKGDRLLLTDVEHTAIESDTRFEEWDDKKHGKLRKGPPAPPTGGTAEEKAAAAKVAEEEKARIENLEKANAEWEVMRTELAQSTFEQLVARAKGMNEEHKSDIVVGPKTSKTELIRMIVEAERRVREKGGE